MQGGTQGGFYRYRGPDGRIVVVDSLSEVPEAQRPGAERVQFTERPAPTANAERDWRFDWPSAATGFLLASLLGVMLFASRRGSRWVLGVSVFLVLAVLGTGAYFGFLRRSTGQGGSAFASPSAVIDDAKRAVDQMERRNREQDQLIRHITLDAGALVAIERRKQRGLLLLDLAKHRLAQLLVPVPVVVEWWRSRTDARERILDAVSVEPLSLADARAAGEALARVRIKPKEKSLASDAIVVAFAATHGGIVFTSDVEDLERIRVAYFPSVRVLGVGDDV